MGMLRVHEARRLLLGVAAFGFGGFVQGIQGPGKEFWASSLKGCFLGDRGDNEVLSGSEKVI